MDPAAGCWSMHTMRTRPKAASRTASIARWRPACRWPSSRIFFWLVDPRSGVGRSVVAHVTEEAAGNPSFEDYFFKKVAPIMDKALAENKQADWPLITLNLDFKSNEPEHHAAVWALLGKYERWLTTAERTATPDVPAPLRLGPMLVLTGSNDAQQISFSDKVPVGERLRVFGATTEPEIPGANRTEKAKNYAVMPVADVIPKGASNYRRWVNFSWGVIEAGGIPSSADWTPAEAERVTGPRRACPRAQSLGPLLYAERSQQGRRQRLGRRLQLWIAGQRASALEGGDRCRHRLHRQRHVRGPDPIQEEAADGFSLTV